MRGTNVRRSRIAGLLALALGAVALLALTGVATAKDRGGDDHGDHGHHGRHHHHLHEMREAGTISSFDPATGRLTITLTGGETTSGLVTTETRIRCEGADDHRADHSADRRDHGGGDNGGRGTEPGDDNGGRGEEPGDDNGGNSGPGPNGPGAEGEGEGPEPGEAPSCTTAALVPGAFVGEAELRLGTGAAVFTEVELGHDS
jgi:hypothetical protein